MVKVISSICLSYFEHKYAISRYIVCMLYYPGLPKAKFPDGCGAGPGRRGHGLRAGDSQAAGQRIAYRSEMLWKTREIILGACISTHCHQPILLQKQFNTRPYPKQQKMKHK